MNAHEREAIRQAKILRYRPDPSGLAEDVARLRCQFKVKYRCQGESTHLEYDPTGEVKLPAPSCNNCHNYLEAAFKKEIASEEAHMRIKLAILMTYEALMEYDRPADPSIWTGLGDK